ncbi:MAG: hypothetical protein A3J46_04735 [Candidatus Yanofskybacteria bacterium RIFCSPHIGHO2_02_FULL_41_11]|uniref:CBS domain-containing protein n=1 Tax=Candidatus Yanofskybacteria bacterium RIFCSPHIGHO2_02_FULL_41_11 TaxID=1802675 RepID=A0A1F8FD40_9BACT|nr:MAG: hypothetical protein A3J46_04735 [Candidatus Yanofskybacteria bacterium RIFCSPHIGHO2_02_FULL_41_11]
MEKTIIKVKDIMTSGWIATINPDDSLMHAAKLFGEYNYDGFPVIDKDKKLMGIVTAYEMVSDSAILHLSELEKILELVSEDKADDKNLEGHFKKLDELKVKDIMNADPLTAKPEMTITELAKEFAKHHRVNPIPVVDEAGHLVGVVSRYDLIRFFESKYLNKVLISGGHESIVQKLGKNNSDDK